MLATSYSYIFRPWTYLPALALALALVVALAVALAVAVTA